MKATINTSVLIALGKLGYLQLLTRLFDGLFVAAAVLEEIRGSEVYAEVESLMDVGSASVAEVSKHELLDVLSSSLGRGEAETIAVAIDIYADIVLLDDLRARRLARRLGMKVMGMLGTLKALIDMGLIERRPEDLCNTLINQGFWIERELCIKILSGTCRSGRLN